MTLCMTQLHKTASLQRKCRDLAKAVQLSYEEDDMRYLQKHIDELQKADRSNNPRKTWKVINEMSGKCSVNPATQVQAPDGKVMENSEELLVEWNSYFEKLLNTLPANSSRPIPPAKNDLPISTGDFTVDD